MIVFDLDGTLAECSWRRYLLPDYDAFNSMSIHDPPMIGVMKIFNYVINSWPVSGVEIWSGRSEKVREQTIEWLSNNVFHTPRAYWLDNEDWVRIGLRMRPLGDTTPDEKLKERWLDEVIANGSKVDFVFDDRNKVVAMWRRRGIPCAQVAPGDF
jgi:hypothetical protein